MRLSVALAVSCLVITTLSAAEHAAAAIRKQTNIGAQGLGPALQELAKHRQFQILYRTELVGDRRTPGAVGEFTLDEALQKLLNGTELTFRYLDDTTVTILPMSIGGGGPTEVSMPPTLTSPATNTAPNESAAPRSFWQRLRIAQADTPAGAGAQPQTGESAETRRVTLEEVVVTAQKREERLQDVPISISVLSGDSLDRSSYANVNEALRSVPGIAMYESSQSGLAKFSVRGVTSNNSLFNGSSAIGYYLDEIPFAFVRFPVSPDTNSYDLERVEILRGPQGTLYGANSLNGVVRVLTKDADLDEFALKSRASVSSTQDGGENYRGDAAMNIPLVPGKLGVRAVAGYADNSGWVDLPAAGLDDVNDGQQKSLRFKANAAPTDNLGVELLAWISRDDRGSSATSTDALTSPARFGERIENEFDAYGLTLNYDFESVSVLSATSYMKFFASSHLDAPLGVDDLYTAMWAEMKSEEIRLNSRGDGQWKWSLGGIYREAEDRALADQLFNSQFQGVGDNIYSSDSFAVYGELSRFFLDKKFELTGGLRYFEDDSTSNEVSVLTPDPPFGVRKDKFTATTPRVVITYHPTDDSSIYASYSQGFRSGFSQNGAVLRLSSGAAPAIDPDRLTNYEIGAKGIVLDGSVSYDLAVYYIDWQDTVQVLTNITGNPANPTIFFGAINSKGIDGIGADAGATVQIGDRLSLGANVSWNDLAFTDDVFSGTTIVYPQGSRPVESPELTAGGHASYAFPISGDYSGEFSASVDYTSKILFRLGAVPQYGDDILQARTSIGLIGPGGWSATLFVDNLTNEDGRIRNASVPAGRADRLRPRTIGLQLEYQF